MSAGTLINVKYADANLDAPDNAISDNESPSEMLTSRINIYACVINI